MVGTVVGTVVGWTGVGAIVGYPGMSGRVAGRVVAVG